MLQMAASESEDATAATAAASAATAVTWATLTDGSKAELHVGCEIALQSHGLGHRFSEANGGRDVESQERRRRDLLESERATERLCR